MTFCELAASEDPIDPIVIFVKCEPTGARKYEPSTGLLVLNEDSIKKPARLIAGVVMTDADKAYFTEVAHFMAERISASSLEVILCIV